MFGLRLDRIGEDELDEMNWMDEWMNGWMESSYKRSAAEVCNGDDVDESKDNKGDG